MIGWREPSSKYEACNVPWTLFSSVLCSLHGTFSNVASVNMDQLPPDCNPHSVAVDLVWLHELGELMQAEGCWKLVLLPGPHQRHPELCWDAIDTSSKPSSTSIYRDERFGSICCDEKPLQVPLQFHKVFGSGFERAARCVVGRCSEGNVIYVGNVISNYSKHIRAFATLPGYMGFIGMSPGGNVIGAIAIEAEARCKSYAHGIWPDWTGQDGRHCEIL